MRKRLAADAHRHTTCSAVEHATIAAAEQEELIKVCEVRAGGVGTIHLVLGRFVTQTVADEQELLLKILRSQSDSHLWHF